MLFTGGSVRFSSYLSALLGPRGLEPRSHDSQSWHRTTWCGTTGPYIGEQITFIKRVAVDPIGTRNSTGGVQMVTCPNRCMRQSQRFRTRMVELLHISRVVLPKG